jgi:hypothetical protein
MEKITNWIAGLFDSDSTVSSKRFVLILMTIWAIGCGAFYVIMVQFGGKESMTTVGLIEFALGSAITLAIGGTAAEAAKKKFESPNTKENEKPSKK